MQQTKYLWQQIVSGFVTSFFLLFPLQAQEQPQVKPLTLDRIVAQPNLDGEWSRQLHWSNDGRYLAYLQSSRAPSAASRRQTTEIWSLDPATSHREQLVSSAQMTEALGAINPLHNSEDSDSHSGNQPLLTEYAWVPENRALLLVTPFTLVWIDLEDGHSRKLLTSKEELNDVKLSPDGHHISFIRNHALWLLDVAAGSTHRFTPPGSDDLREAGLDWPYRNELHLPTAYWWSPDSSTIAYLETDDRATDKYALRSSTGDERTIDYPKPGGTLPTVHLFIQTVTGAARRAIDLGNAGPAYIPRVAWLPDSRHLAVEHLSRDQKNLDLFLANTETGKSRAILSEKDSYWINLGDGPHFLRDSRRFLWTSERSGYRHLYLYDIEGHPLAQLTHGDWEVTSLAGIDEAAGQVYFIATEKSSLERQVYRVGLDAAGFARITQETGTHEALFAPSGNFFVDNYSNRNAPPTQQLLRVDGSKVAAITEKPDDAGLATSNLPPIDFLTVKTHMGTELNALMIRPPDFDPARKYPAIVYINGSPGQQLVRDAWGGSIFLWLRMMAQKGYVIYAQDGQGSAGRGHLFEEPLHLRFSSQEMADQRDGTRYLRSLPYIDSARIGIFGWGYGGFLTLHAMLDLPVAYKAGIAGAPITDWHLYDAVFVERYLEDPVRNQDGYLSSSPTENAKNLKGPLLIVQGMTDERVHIENTLTLLNEFLETAKYPSVMFLPDRGYVFDDPEAKLVLYRNMTEFFLKNL